ncbi:hypothetical protein HGB07_08690, partial [Candidatus Roizmanbacteria bacterium]|nr:hypothetical protein [Candidatus Roizmanbacteria bacterium]
TLEAAETLKKIPEMTSNADILITVFSPELLPESLKLTKTLRAGGAKVDISIDYEKKMDKQLKYANKNNIPYVAFIGPEEVKNGTIKLKSMATGQQTSFKLEETPEELKKKN